MSIRDLLDRCRYGDNPIRIQNQKRVGVFDVDLLEKEIAAAIAAVACPDRHAHDIPSGTDIAKTFRLSPAETQVAHLLLQGMRIKQIAAVLKRAKPTIRTQLRSIFQQAHVNTQADFIRKVAVQDGWDTRPYQTGIVTFYKKRLTASRSIKHVRGEHVGGREKHGPIQTFTKLIVEPEPADCEKRSGDDREENSISH